jgi:3',5'-cyclic AMP phosphodiesterase CpdA
VTTRLLHLSDLHLGANERPEIEPALRALIERVEPVALVASGDLTHRGTAAQHDRAAAFLRGFGLPVVAVPGNHDIPYTFPARFTRPWAEFDRVWETTQPVLQQDGLLVVGLNSVRPWRHQSGRIAPAQLERAAAVLRAAAPDDLRVVTLHHHLLGAPWRAKRKRPVRRRNDVLAALVDAGADLILAGHIHQAAVSERHEFELSFGNERSVVVSIAPGLGQPRPDRRGEARGLHVYALSAEDIVVETYVWREPANDWGLTAERRFPRGRTPLAEPLSDEDPSVER